VLLQYDLLNEGATSCVRFATHLQLVKFLGVRRIYNLGFMGLEGEFYNWYYRQKKHKNWVLIFNAALSSSLVHPSPTDKHLPPGWDQRFNFIFPF
jgi:hypothetical protein